MSDALVSNTATLEQPSQDGQAERASGERIQGGTDGQPSSKGQVAKDNVAEIQRIKDREINELRKNFQNEQRQRDQVIQQLQQRLNQMEDNAAPDDYARAELRIQRLEQERNQYAQAYQQAVQAQEAERARQSALKEVADEFGVSVKDLEAAEDYKSAVKLAVKAQREQETRKQQNDEQRAADNRPDVGGGAPRTAMSDWERQYRDAQERKDTAAQMKLLRTRPKQKGE